MSLAKLRITNKVFIGAPAKIFAAEKRFPPLATACVQH